MNRITQALGLLVLTAGALWLVPGDRHQSDAPESPIAEANSPDQESPLTELLDLSASRGLDGGDEGDLEEHSPRQETVLDEGDRLVRVFGQIRRTGRPVADHDIEFQNLADAEEGDWDFTDSSGSYEVHLSPSTYHILHEDETWLQTVVVPAGGFELRVDLDL